MDAVKLKLLFIVGLGITNAVHLQLVNKYEQSICEQKYDFRVISSSDCGSVGRLLTSDTRGFRFESSHWQNLYRTMFTAKCIEKTKSIEKEAGNGPFVF